MINFQEEQIGESEESFSKSSSSINNNMRKVFFKLVKEDKTLVLRNLDKDTTMEEIEQLFNKFGTVNKVTFICDKYSGVFKG